MKKGSKHSLETRKKMGLALKGNKYWLGKKHSEETKIKIGLSGIGKKKHSKEWKKQLSERMKGNKFNVGRKHTEKWKEKMRGRIPWNKGKLGEKQSQETIEKRRKSFKEWWQNPNNSNLIKIRNKKVSESLKGKKCPKRAKFKENNPMWMGGIQHEPYDENWTNNFKRLIRKRDNQVCMVCGVHREKLKQALSVHHINYDKRLSIPQNCISLCSPCHIKTNGNRKRWKYFLQSLLFEKYNYKYQNGKIILEVKNEKN